MNHDDKPIGSCPRPSRTYLPTNSDTSITDNSLNGRLISKAWKTRYDAFEELTCLLSTNNLENAKVHSPLFVKYLADPHPGVQEKALEAFNELSKRHLKEVQLKEVVNVMLERGMASMKPSVKAKTVETFIELSRVKVVRIEVARIIAECLDKCKVTKVIVGGIQILVELMRVHSKGAFEIEETMKSIEKNAISSNNGSVRNEALEFYKMAYTVFGESMRVFINRLKPGQQEELLKALQESDDSYKSKGESAPASATRELSSRHDTEDLPKDKKSEQPSSKSKDASINISAIPLPKEFDSMPEIINNKKEQSLEKFDSEWCSELLSLKNWKDKQSKLNGILCTLSSSSKLIKTSPDLIPTLRKLIADNNITVAQVSLKIITILATNLKDQFKAHYKSILKHTIVRLKDKRANIEVIKCLEALIPFIVFDDVIDDIKEALIEKSPLLRIGLCQWLEKSLLPVSSNAKSLSELFPILLGFMDEAAGDVRESGLECLRRLCSIGRSDPSIQKQISELPQQKAERIRVGIEESMPKVQVVPKLPLNINEQQRTLESKKSVVEEKVVRKITRGPSKKNVHEGTPTAEITDVDAERIIGGKIPQKINETINDPDWKNRLRGFQEFSTWLFSNKDIRDNFILPLTIWLKTKLKDFKESNQTILKEAFGIMAFMVESVNVNKKVAGILVGGIIEKMGDTKWYEVGAEIILNLTISSGPPYIINKIIEKVAVSGKNLNLIKGALLIVIRIIENNESSSLPFKEILECAKQLLTNANSSVRSVATSLLCCLYKIMGESLKSLLNDLKDPTMKAVELELNKIKPTKKQSEVKISNKPEKIEMQITQQLLDNINDPVIRVRQNAKSQLEKIFATNIENFQADELINALKERLKEPYKNLCKDFIALIGNIALSIGSSFKKYLDVILNPLVENLGDKQGFIREETVCTMNKIGEAVGIEHIITHIGHNLQADSSEMRNELLIWILKQQDSIPKAECQNLVSGIILCLQDNSNEIKEKAQKLLSLVIPIVGVMPFNSIIENTNNDVKNYLKVMIAKHIPSQVSKTSVEVNQAYGFNSKAHIETTYAEKTISTTKESVSKKLVPKKIEMAPGSNEAIKDPFLEFAEESILKNDKMQKGEYDKTYRWNIEDIKEEHIRVLKDQLKLYMQSSVHNYMFSNENKDILKAISNLSNAIIIDEYFKKTIYILDFILKWVTFIMMGRPEILSETIELVKELFEKLHRVKRQLMNIEATSIFPALCECIRIENVKDNIKEILRNAGGILPLPKVGNYLVRALHSDSNSTKTECLSLLKEFVSIHGLKVITARDIKVFGKIMNQATDIELVNECKGLLAEVYRYKGDGIWLSLGDLNDKAKETLQSTFSKIQNVNSNEIAFFPLSNSQSIELFKLHERKLKKVMSMEECLRALAGHDLKKKMEGLRIIEKDIGELMEYKEVMFAVLASVLHDMFEVNEYPISFVVQCLTLINKICSHSELIYDIPCESIGNFIQELLFSLLNSQSTKFGEAQEDIKRLLNSSMLSFMEKCSLNTSFQVLISLYEKCNTGKLPELIVKCLLKLTKMLKEKVSDLEISKLLLTLHEYISNIQKTNAHSETGTRVVKTILNELIKLEGEKIWDDYKVIEERNNLEGSLIKRWISLMLSNMKAKDEIKAQEEETLRLIFTYFNTEDTFGKGIMELSEYKRTHPHCELTKYFQGYPKEVADCIMELLNTQTDRKTLSTFFKITLIVENNGKVEYRRITTTAATTEEGFYSRMRETNYT